MNMIARIWTASVAYVALVLGAGLSITFNVVDTLDIRGPAVDRWDIVTAVAFPALVVLTVELFVSRRWPRYWPMQVIRWAGCLAVGAIAMRVSWVHGHDFFLSRGQATDVAVMAPLAIDLLAIMATALILSGRTAAANVQDKPTEPPMSNANPFQGDVSNWTGPVASVQDVAESEAAFRGEVSNVQDTAKGGQIVWTSRTGPVADVQDTAEVAFPMVSFDQAAADVRDALDMDGETLASEVDSYLAKMSNPIQDTTTPAVPVVSGELPTRTRAPRIDEAAALDMVRQGMQEGMAWGQIDQVVAEWFKVNPRTVRRLRGVHGLS